MRAFLTAALLVAAPFLADGEARAAESATKGTLTCTDYGALIKCDNGETYRRQPRAPEPPRLESRMRENPALQSRHQVHATIRAAYEDCVGLLPREAMALPRPVQYGRFPDFPACLERIGREELKDDGFALNTYKLQLGLPR